MPKCVALLIFHDFLKYVIYNYLRMEGFLCSFPFNCGTACVSIESLVSIERQDVFIVEAFDSLTFDNPQGFRLVLKCMQLRRSIRPLVIIPALDAEFLAHPCLLDYKSLARLPDKLERITQGKPVDSEIFDALVREYPNLIREPHHV